MLKVNRLISSIVLVAFLSTTALTDLSLAQQKTDMLSPPALTGTLGDLQHKDAGRIQIALENQLMSLAQASAADMHVDFQTLKTIFGEQMRAEWTSREKTVYQPSDMQFFFHELELTPIGPCVMCRIGDPENPNAPPRSYYAVFSMRRDADGGFPIQVFTKDEYDQSGGLTATIPLRSEADADAIQRYVQHEKTIDPWIARHMEQGDYSAAANDNKAARALAAEMHALPVRNELDALSRKNDFWLQTAIETTPIIFIKVRNGEALPTIVEDGREVTVRSHASQSAVYIFLDEFAFDVVHRGLTDSKYLVRGSDQNIETVIRSQVAPLLIHEIGVKFGFPWRVTSEGEIENDLDVAYRLLERAQNDPMIRQSPEFARVMDLVRSRIDDREGIPVDLDRNTVGRDYAAGAGSIDFESITGMMNAARLVIVLSGLYKKETFSEQEFVQACKDVHANADLLQFTFPMFAADDRMYDNAKQALAALAEGDSPFLMHIEGGYRAARWDAYADRPAYEMNFDIFSGLAGQCIGRFGFTGVLFKDRSRLVIERVRDGGKYRDQVSFDLRTGNLTFVTVSSNDFKGSRLEVGTRAVMLLDTEKKEAPFNYHGTYPVINALVGPNGDSTLIVSRRFYDLFMAAVTQSSLNIPFVSIACEDERIPAGEIVVTDDMPQVALSRKPASSSAAKAPRNADGTFKNAPGKSPEDVFILIVRSHLRREKFTIDQYLDAYRENRERLELEALAEKAPESTARRDLDKLVAARILTVDKSGKAFKYALADAALRTRIAQIYAGHCLDVIEGRIEDLRESKGEVERSYQISAEAHDTVEAVAFMAAEIRTLGERLGRLEAVRDELRKIAPIAAARGDAATEVRALLDKGENEWEITSLIEHSYWRWQELLNKISRNPDLKGAMDLAHERFRAIAAVLSRDRKTDAVRKVLGSSSFAAIDSGLAAHLAASYGIAAPSLDTASLAQFSSDAMDAGASPLTVDALIPFVRPTRPVTLTEMVDEIKRFGLGKKNGDGEGLFMSVEFPMSFSRDVVASIRHLLVKQGKLKEQKEPVAKTIQVEPRVIELEAGYALKRRVHTDEERFAVILDMLGLYNNSELAQALLSLRGLVGASREAVFSAIDALDLYPAEKDILWLALAPAEKSEEKKRGGQHRPGKSPRDLMRLIAFDAGLQNEPFSVRDLLASYQDAREAAPQLGFEALSVARPDDTMRRDLKWLEKQMKFVEPAKERGIYRLTKKGQEEIVRLRGEMQTELKTDLAKLIPQSLIDACASKKERLVVGVPKEIKPFAERVGLTPEGVRVLVSFGVTVLVEKGAGREHFSDDAYRRAGARLVDTPRDVWDNARIIVKVKEPLESKVLGINELELMREGQIVYTYLHLAMKDCRDLAYALYRKNVTGIAYETIIVDENGKPVTPALRPMSIIAGNLGGYFSVIYSLWSEIAEAGGRKTVALTAEGTEAMKRLKADYTSAAGFKNIAKGRKAVVLGGGVAGERMAKTLLRQGVSVTITDADPGRVAELTRTFSIYGKQAEVMLVSRDIDSPSAALLERYKEADILGGCILVPGAKAPQMGEKLFAEISAAKPKTIVDIAIDQDGNFPEARATYYSDPVYVDSWGNKRFSVANMPDYVGGVASVELEKSKIVWNLALTLGLEKALELFPELSGGVNMREGKLYVEKLYGLYPDIPQGSSATASAGSALPAIVGRRSFDYNELRVSMALNESSGTTMEEIHAALVAYLKACEAQRRPDGATAGTLDLVIDNAIRTLAVSPDAAGITYDLILTGMRTGESLDFKIVRRDRQAGTFVEIGQASMAARKDALPADTLQSRKARGELMAARETIGQMTALASDAGAALPTHPLRRYTLFVPQIFCANGDLARDQARFGDRFDLAVIPGLSKEDFIGNVRKRVAGKEKTSIVLVPNDLQIEDAELKEFTDSGVRFMYVNAGDVHDMRLMSPSEKAAFRTDTYAVMLLGRQLDKETPADSSVYRLFKYYLETHFMLGGGVVTADDYITAFLNGDQAKLIKSCLSYKPAVPVDAVEEYRRIAETLIFA